MPENKTELTEKEWQEIQDDLDQKHKDFEDVIKNAKPIENKNFGNKVKK